MHAEKISEAIKPIPQTINLDSKKVFLGETLFNDIRLSSNNAIACASCHQLEQGGDDGLSRSITNSGAPDVANAPTVFNSKFNFRFTWRGEFRKLEQQARADIINPRHTNIKIEILIKKLKLDNNYVDLFNLSYETGLTEFNLLDAISIFQQSLITPGARFDLYLLGDNSAITDVEKSGYELFKLYGCISCHQGINVGGNMFQKLGILNDYFTKGQTLSRTDLGRFVVTNREEDKHVFKVPSLRNIEVTAPYLHDGSVATLADTIKIMAKYQLGQAIPTADIEKIVAFLKTLTGKYKGKYLNTIIK